MHKMMHEKHVRHEQIRADQAAVDSIDATIKTNIQPCLVSMHQAPGGWADSFEWVLQEKAVHGQHKVDLCTPPG